MIPRSTPKENAAPMIAGPTARPIALTLVPTPFRVPRTLRLEAELVNRMVVQGNPNIDADSLPSMRRKTVMWRNEGGTRAVNGVRKYRTGKTRATVFKQLRTPYRFAAVGKTINCTNMPMMPMRV